MDSTTDSNIQFNFTSRVNAPLGIVSHLTLEIISIDQMINLGTNGNPWNSHCYKVPVPYLRPRVLNKDQPEPGKCRFVPTLADGPEHKFANEKKGIVQKNYSYGKEAKVPPVSYLPINDWSEKIKKKNVVSNDKNAKSVRGSFIDTIYFNAKKYNLPGPNKYFASTKKENKEVVKKTDKKLVRPNFLCDYEYLGMNVPGPGSYRFKDKWADLGKKRAVTADKKHKAIPQDWKIKNDKVCGPGRYDITRLMTIQETNKEKHLKAFVNIPTLERTTFGLINKVVLFAKRRYMLKGK